MGLQYLQLVKAEQKEITSKSTGRKFKVWATQGMLVYDNGAAEVFVLDLFENEARPLGDLKPGKYLPVIEPVPSRDSRKLEARIVELRPFIATPAAKAA